MTERENLMHVLRRTGKAAWIPIAPDCCRILPSAVDRDRPILGETGNDWFGCRWIYDDLFQGYYQVPSDPLPLTDLSRWREQVVFPDLDAIDWEDAAKRDLAGYDRERQALYIRTQSGPFERVHQLYGFENTFVAMYEEPEEFSALIDEVTRFRIRFFEKIITWYRPDMVMMMDDLGHARGPLMSLDMYRDLIKPYDRKIVEALHSHGVFVIYHSCGCVQDFVGDLVEMGADLIHPLQGGINDQEQIEAQFGDKVVFVNCLDNLVHLPETTEQELRREMRRVLTLFSEKKNLLVQPNSRVAGHNDILLDEARKFNAELGRR